MTEEDKEKDESHYEDLPDDKLAEEIENVSPEGAPAHPEVGPRRIGLIYIIVVSAAVIAALVIGIIFGPMIGVVFGLLMLALLLINPGTWAAFHRARERKRAENRTRERLSQEQTGDKQ